MAWTQRRSGSSEQQKSSDSRPELRSSNTRGVRLEERIPCFLYHVSTLQERQSFLGINCTGGDLPHAVGNAAGALAAFQPADDQCAGSVAGTLAN